MQRAADTRQVTVSDALLVARWLNESTGTSHVHIRAIYEQLEEIRNRTTALQRQHEELRRKVAARDKTNLPARGAQYKSAFRQLEKRHRTLNEALRRYVFRPLITYTVITDTRAAGLSPDTSKRWFQLQFGEWMLSEPDAAMSLVRLYLMGELHRVQLCANCKERWFVAAKAHYKFCSQECRESYYPKSPDFHQRKAEIQRKYRANLKRPKAAFLA